MREPRSTPARITIGSVCRQPGTPAAASADAVQGLRDGLAGLGASVMAHRVPSGHLPPLSIRVLPGAGATEIAEAVRRAAEAAIRSRLG
jgi:hypothetical protein